MKKYSNYRYHKNNKNTKPPITQGIKDIKCIKPTSEKNNKFFISKGPSQVNNLNKEEKQKSMHEMIEDVKIYMSNELLNMQNNLQDVINILKNELRQ